MLSQNVIIGGLVVSNVVTAACLGNQKKENKKLNTKLDALNVYSSERIGEDAIEAMYKYCNANDIGIAQLIQLKADALNDQISLDQEINKSKAEAKEKVANRKKVSGPAKKAAEQPVEKVQGVVVGEPNPVLQ